MGQLLQALTPLQGCLRCAGLHCSRAQLPQPQNSQLKVARHAQRLVQLLLLPRAPLQLIPPIAVGRAAYVNSSKQTAPPVFSEPVAQATLVLAKPETPAAQLAQME